MNNSVEDNFSRFVGGASVVLALTATLPQIYYSCKTKTAQGCSWWFLMSRVGITVLMVIYGIYLGATMLIFLNVVCGVGAFVMVYYKFIETFRTPLENEEENEENNDINLENLSNV